VTVLRLGSSKFEDLLADCETWGGENCFLTFPSRVQYPSANALPSVRLLAKRKLVAYL
jgi:hypothetical protein